MGAGVVVTLAVFVCPLAVITCPTTARGKPFAQVPVSFAALGSVQPVRPTIFLRSRPTKLRVDSRFSEEKNDLQFAIVHEGASGRCGG